MTKKEKRQKQILEIISAIEINTQEELTGKLIELGYDVTQATVSRDINELNLIKVEGKSKRQRYAASGVNVDNVPKNLIEMLKNMIVSVIPANNLIVVRTLAGNANSVATILDKISMPQILGTIAGDDTIFIATKSNKDADITIKRIKDIL